MRKIILIIVSAILLLTAVSCNSGEPEYTPTTTAPAYAQPIAEAMLKAISDNDYQGFCFYITSDMAARNPQDIWGYFRDFYKSRIGDYISLQLYDVTVQGTRTTVIYWAKYSKADKVTVTIVFIPYNNTVAVDDLVLDSPELWQNPG
jgi:hypothetical protein